MISVLKDWLRNVLFQPRGVVMGARSTIRLPRKIFNPERLIIGRDGFIGRLSVINPVKNYAGKSYNGRIVLGDQVYIGGFCQLHVIDTLEIGDGCVLSEHVYISDLAHGLNPMKGAIMRQPLESKGSVKIGKRVFIGYGCSILPGVTLGDNCIVGTRSVVTRSFPSYSMIAGCPARLIKRFDLNTQQWQSISDSDG